MRSVYYKNGKITVIRDDAFIMLASSDKPAFLGAADGVEYDLTKAVFVTNGVMTNMTADDIAEAEKFITEYVFNTNDVVSEVVYGHAVNKYGDYVGYVELNDDLTEVPTGPADDGVHYFWSGEAWLPAYAVEKPSGALVGDVYIDTLSFTNKEYIYIDKSLVVSLESSCTTCQTYNFETKTVDVNMTLVKTKLITMLHNMLNKKHAELLGSASQFEIASYQIQYAEALSYQKDATASTPFIDALLVGRAIADETKDILVSKILNKATEYASFGIYIGKHQKAIKAVETANDINELLDIYNNWEK